MRRTRFDERPCPLARTTDLLGDWWTPLILWELALGRTRFGELEEALGCARSVLTQRLHRLVDEGIVIRAPYTLHPPRYDYRLSKKGNELRGVLISMWRWGSDWMFDGEGPSYELVDSCTGEGVRPVVIDEATGECLEHTHLRRSFHR
jgi:DNA-binding HxlR family transcriptional regulator